MVNGVQIQDNLRGDPLNLFIEDAIQETTVITSGVSAEYGRFTGGIVNTLTKSGGNVFSGSFRDIVHATTTGGIESPVRRAEEATTWSRRLEFTAGRSASSQDRLWFFGAGRVQDRRVRPGRRATRTLPTPSTEREALRGQVTPGARQGPAARGRATLGIPIAAEQRRPARRLSWTWPASTNPDHAGIALRGRTTPARSAASSSSRRSTRRRADSPSSTPAGLRPILISGTPLHRTRPTGAWWWAPNFCGVCSRREARQRLLVAEGQLLRVDDGPGAHDIVVRLRRLQRQASTRRQPSVGASDYHVWATGSEIVDGIGLSDHRTRLQHVDHPLAGHGVQPAARTSGRTRCSSTTTGRSTGSCRFNLGLRYDKNAGRDASNVLVANDSLLSPRLGVAWHPAGDGRTTIAPARAATWRPSTTASPGSTAPAGHALDPRLFLRRRPDQRRRRAARADRRRPAAGLQLVRRGAARSVLRRHPGRRRRRINGSLKSPHARRVHGRAQPRASTRGVGPRRLREPQVRRLLRRTHRHDDRHGLRRVRPAVRPGAASRTRTCSSASIGRSTSRAPYRPATASTSGASYTLSRLWGNFDGETSAPGRCPTSALTIYPEYHQPRAGAIRTATSSADQRHRARLWAIYSLPLGPPHGTRCRSACSSRWSPARPTARSAPCSSSPFVADPGYAILPPDTMSYYFSAAGRLPHRRRCIEPTCRFNMSRRLRVRWRARRSFAQFQVLNVFNQFQLFNITDADINTTVVTAADDPNLEFFNPFTETPVEGRATGGRAASSASPRAAAPTRCRARSGSPSASVLDARRTVTAGAGRNAWPRPLSFAGSRSQPQPLGRRPASRPSCRSRTARGDRPCAGR